MRPQKTTVTKPSLIAILGGSVNTIFGHNIVLIPFVTIAFIQFLLLEILFFAPRFPLVSFFGPIIEKRWGQANLHYPFNLEILPEFLQFFQIPIYIFINSFLIGLAIAGINAINNNQKVGIKTLLRQTLPSYIHIIVSSLISFGVFWGVFKVFKLVFARALQLNPNGPYKMLRSVIVDGAPYFELFIGAFVTIFFVYVIPIIIIEKKKIFAAIALNFKTFFSSVLFTVGAVIIPTIFYLPMVLLRNEISEIAHNSFPEIRVVSLIVSIIIMVLIDAVIYTSVATFYLVKKEN